MRLNLFEKLFPAITLPNGLKVTIARFNKQELQPLREAYQRSFKCKHFHHGLYINIPYWTAEVGGIVFGGAKKPKCAWTILSQYKDFYVVTFHFKHKLHAIVHEMVFKSKQDAIVSKPELALELCMMVFLEDWPVYASFDHPKDFVFCDGTSAVADTRIKILQDAIKNNTEPEIAALIYP